MEGTKNTKGKTTPFEHFGLTHGYEKHRPHINDVKIFISFLTFQFNSIQLFIFISFLTFYFYFLFIFLFLFPS